MKNWFIYDLRLIFGNGPPQKVLFSEIFRQQQRLRLAQVFGIQPFMVEAQV
jgi:hypothetical protein